MLFVTVVSHARSAPWSGVPNAVGFTVSWPLAPRAEIATEPSAVLPSTAAFGAAMWMPVARAARNQAASGESARRPVSCASGVSDDETYTTFQVLFALTTETDTTPSADSTLPKACRNETTWNHGASRIGSAFIRRRLQTERRPKACLCAAR